VINFRYHVVSIVAVFLALAIGIVLGATELQGATLDALRAGNKDLNNNLAAARAQNAALRQQLAADQGFAQANEGRLLDGLLSNQRVVVVTAPGAPSAVVSGVTAAAQKAGATLTGQVNLQPKMLDASENNLQYLSALVQQAVPAGSTPPSGTPLQQAAKLLGSAILTKDTAAGSGSSGTTGGSSSNQQSVLSYYARAGLLSVSGPLSTSQSSLATLAIVVPPGTVPPGGDSASANQGLITLTQQLNSAGLGTVMAGSVTGSVAGSAISALRSSSAASQISTVDDADTLEGQIVTMQALANAMTGHKAASYGEDSASAAGPSPAPTPASSVPATTSTGSKPSGKKSGKNGSHT
jgi:Copper transport outer membrane protein, MctB